jgi:hypothetical protein
LFDRAGPFAALAYGAALPLNMIRHMPGVRLQRAEEVTLGANLTQTDGDPGDAGPTLVRNATTPIRVVVA